VRGVADERGPEDGPARPPERLEPEERERAEEAARGDEGEAVSEVAMKSPGDGRVGRRGDENVEVRGHPGQPADEPGRARELPGEDGLRGRRAEHALGHWVHKGFRLEMCDLKYSRVF